MASQHSRALANLNRKGKWGINNETMGYIVFLHTCTYYRVLKALYVIKWILREPPQLSNERW